MKMRASFGKVVICALAGFCIFSLAFLIAIHKDAAVREDVAVQGSLLSAKKALNASPAKTNAKWIEAYAKLPMGFEENRGQTDPRVRFVSHGTGYELFLTPREAVLALSSPKRLDFSPKNRTRTLRELARARAAARASVLQVRLSGANPGTEVAGIEKLPGRTNYFLGNDRSAWKTDIPSYRRVKYAGIYPGIDLVFYGNQRQLEYDYVVAPGADPRPIALDVEGARKLAVNSQGNLVISMPDGDVVLQKPVVYQDVNGERRLVAANYSVSDDHQIRFALGSYDSSKTLTIDPVLNYSTYLGGSASATAGDAAFGIAVDAAGDAYITGQTFNTSFPLSAATIGYNTNSPDPGVATNGAVFVSELDPTGTTELYFTYLGGTGAGEGSELGFGIAVDAGPLVYITGSTLSTNYPTVNAYESAGNAFLSVLDPATNGTGSLVYSTYVGGTSGDFGNAVAVDSNKNAFITGITYSAGIATTGALQTTLPGTDGNAFFTEVNTAGSSTTSEVYSTYLGGTGIGGTFVGYGDEGWGIAVASGNAYIVGTTTSTDFPTTASAFVASPNTQAANGTVFVSEINPSTSALVYSSYVSGATVATTGDFGFAIATGPNNIAYITGDTTSTDFYVFPAGSAISPAAGTGVAFLALVDGTKSGANSIPYSTTFGGANSDNGFGIQVDSTGNAYIGGVTDSINPTTFPVTPGALQTTSTNTAGGVAFVSVINPGGVNGGTACSGSACLTYSTLFGGTGAGGAGIPDEAHGLALGPLNTVYIAGQVGSTDFPIYPPTAFQTTLTPGDEAGFAASLTPQPTVVISPLTVNFGTVFISSNSTMTTSVTNNTGLALSYFFGAIQGSNPGDFALVPGGAGACGATLPTNNTPCTLSIKFTPTVNGNESASFTFTYSPYGISNTQTVNLTGAGTNVALAVSPQSLTFAGQMVSSTSAAQQVTITNNGGSALAYTATLSDTTDYAAALTTGSACTATSIPATTTCMYNVTFTPASATANPIAATFTIAAGGVNNVVNLSGTGWQFTMTPSSLTASAAPGASPNPAPSFTLTLVGGFPGPVNLTCTGSIPLGSCTVPASVSASGTVTVTLTTKASSFTPPGSPRVPPISPRQMLFIGLGILSLLALRFARRRRQKLGLVGALMLMIALTACSGSAGTPAGTYNLTVTGTGSGSGTGNTQTANVTIAFTVT